MTIGFEIHSLASALWGFDRVLQVMVFGDFACDKEHIPDLQIREIPTGTQVFDWEIPESGS